MQQILVATDFSENADHAVRAAGRFARAYGARVLLMHAYDPFGPAMDYPALVWTGADLWTQLRDETVKLIGQTRQRFLEDVAVVEELAVAHASPAAAICETARERGVDVVMVGTHGRTGVTRLVLGSVAERVVRHAPCRVLTVRPQAAPDVFPSHILVTTDFSPASEAALQDAAMLTDRFNARITLAHVFGTPTALARQAALRDVETELRDRLTQMYQRHFRQAVSIALLSGGSPADAIAELARERSCDLIVMATHGRTGLARLIIGSVAEKTLRLAPCAVWASRSVTQDEASRAPGPKPAPRSRPGPRPDGPAPSEPDTGRAG
jgi:nucleotide-binding universal stress UspA family protein